MKESSYSRSPYGQMRDRIAKRDKARKEEKRKAEGNYYSWLISWR